MPDDAANNEGKLKTRNRTKDVQFIVDEVRRIANLPIKEIMAVDRRDAFCEIPHPSGNGHLICGRSAWDRLLHLTEVYLGASPYKLNINIVSLRKEIAKLISSRFLGENRPINDKEVDRILAGALKLACKQCADTTHYIPCQISGDESPDIFNIGPVIFHHRKFFMKNIEIGLNNYTQIVVEERIEVCKKSPNFAAENLDTIRNDAEKHARIFTDGASSWFSKFGWVAEITIRRCDPKISKSRADRTVEGALNVLRLFLGEYFSDRLHVGGTRVAPIEQATIRKLDDGNLDISLSRDSASQYLGKEWWPVLVKHAGEPRLTAAGVALDAVACALEAHTLSYRFMDAVSWFGQAVLDPLPAARIVKYATAIERMVVCEEGSDINKTIGQRVAALCFDPIDTQKTDWYEHIGEIYSWRSNLVHGTISPFDPRLESAALLAEHVARFTLITGLDFFGFLGLGATKISPKKLSKAYDQLVTSNYAPKLSPTN